MRKIMSLIVLALFIATPLLAQTDISTTNPSFSWTGKQGDQAGYRWSAEVNNPTRRTVAVSVTLQLIDASGNVVAADSKTMTMEREGKMDVSGEANMPYADARRVAQYRIMINDIKD